MISKTAAQQYLRNVLSLEQHIYEAVDQQTHHDQVGQHSEASKLLSKMVQILGKHIVELEKYFGALSEVVALKENISPLAPAKNGSSSYSLKEDTSEFLRNDYGALCLAIISYVKIESIGLALQTEEITRLAQTHLADLKPLVEKIEYIMPLVVAQELATTEEVVEATPEGQQVIWNATE